MGKPQFTASELDSIYAVIIGACSLSIVGSLYVLVHIYRLRVRGGITSTQTMVAILSLLDLAVSLPKVIRVAGDDGSFACNVQGFLLSFLAVMSVVWNVCFAHSIYRKIVCRESEERLQRRLRLYIIVTIVPAFIASCVQYATNLIADATFYCWLPQPLYQLVFLYVWVILSIVYITVVLFVTQHHINKRAEIQGNLEAFASSAAITRQLRLYIVFFVINWLPSVIFRVTGPIFDIMTFPMAILMQATLCSIGFVTGIIYGGFLTHSPKFCQFRAAGSDYHAMTAPTQMTVAMTGEMAPSMNGRRQPLSLFVTTFNMGEGAISDEELEKWIPRGYDLYVIGVQECLQLQDLRVQIRSHIEGQASLRVNTSRSRFVRYAQFCREIGSTNTSLGYHGYIAITVFVRQRDVMSGAFFMAPKAQQAMNCGKSLLFGQRASNKGAVGFGFRYFDTSFAFVTCHLTSDIKGKSHVDRRNRDATDVIKSLHLNVDDLGFEFPLMHHHTFILGDLNYRLRQNHATPTEILELMVNARLSQPYNATHTSHRTKATKRARGRLLKKASTSSSKWIPAYASGDSDYSTAASMQTDMGSTSSTATEPKYIGIPIIGGGYDTPTLEDKEANTRMPAGGDAWEAVLAHDELRHLMNQSHVFYGFEEPRIAFDPTFRRVRQRGLPANSHHLTAEELATYYTTAIDGRGQRVPSYTDRILHFSQPDMRLRLQCSQYTSAEDVTCSDHKPVSAVFHTHVNRESRPLVARADLEDRPRLQAVPGVVECTLQIECLSLTWHHNAHAVLDSVNMNHLRVTVMFPLPSEDAFSEQRTLHELAAHLRGGMFTTTSPGDAEPMANSASLPYAEFRAQGVHHVTTARLVAAMHVTLKIHADPTASSSRCVGQGVIGLPKSVLDGSGERMPFLMTLSCGGQVRGTLEGSVSLVTAQATAT